MMAIESDPGAGSVYSFLRGLDEQGGEAHGVWLAGDPAEPLGLVVVENGRICWAQARACRGRLIELLREAVGGDRDLELTTMLTSLVNRERENLVPSLLSSGLMVEQQLRDIFLQHSAEAMATLASATEVWSWLPRDPTMPPDEGFAFSTAELWVAMDGSGLSGAQQYAREHLARATQQGVCAIALSRGLTNGGNLVAVSGLQTVDEVCRMKATAEQWLNSLTSLETRVHYRKRDTSAAECLWFEEDIVFMLRAPSFCDAFAKPNAGDRRRAEVPEPCSGVFARAAVSSLA